MFNRGAGRRVMTMGAAAFLPVATRSFPGVDPLARALDFPDHIQRQKSVPRGSRRDGFFRSGFAHALDLLPLGHPGLAIDPESIERRFDRRHSRHPRVAVTAVQAAAIQTVGVLRLRTVGVQPDRSVIQKPNANQPTR